MKILQEDDINRIIEMAWEDRTPFDAIKIQFGLSEDEVVELMRLNLKKSSWLNWRKRVTARKTKHSITSEVIDFRFKCTRQKEISRNKYKKKQKGH
ncbi:MAG: TIGR03643 family protein [Cytophagales bacterium]